MSEIPNWLIQILEISVKTLAEALNTGAGALAGAGVGLLAASAFAGSGPDPVAKSFAWLLLFSGVAISAMIGLIKGAREAGD